MRARPPRFSRREALGLLGMSAGIGVITAWGEESALAGAAFHAFQAARIPRKLTILQGAIIRTILKDVQPQTVAGATMMHEHLLLNYGSPPRPRQAAVQAGRVGCRLPAALHTRHARAHRGVRGESRRRVRGAPAPASLVTAAATGA